MKEVDVLRQEEISDIGKWALDNIAFPFLSGREQIDALLSVSSECSILAGLMDASKPLEEKAFDDLLKSACQNEDEHTQFVLLGFARKTLTPISIDSRKHIAHLSKAQSERVRVQALGIIAQLDDEILLTKVARGDWRVSESKEYEAFYGSTILVQAAAYGIIEYSEALDRMSSDFYGRAAEAWSQKGMQDAMRDVAVRVHASIRTPRQSGEQSRTLAGDPRRTFDWQTKSAAPVRNTWARHWFSQMCGADEADEFWCFSVLFAKIVDGRYEFWRSEYEDRNEPMRLFWPSVRSKLRNRFKKWENLRNKKLFGDDAPSRIFLF